MLLILITTYLTISCLIMLIGYLGRKELGDIAPLIPLIALAWPVVMVMMKDK